jgi:hypothetical protein
METSCAPQGENVIRRHIPIYLIVQIQCADCEKKSPACHCLTCAESPNFPAARQKVFDSFVDSRDCVRDYLLWAYNYAQIKRRHLIICLSHFGLFYK